MQLAAMDQKWERAFNRAQTGDQSALVNVATGIRMGVNLQHDLATGS